MRHPDFQAQDRSLRKTGPSADGALSRLFDNHPVFMNEPVHRPTHQAAFRALAIHSPDALLSHCTQFAHEILDTLIEKQEVDLTNDYAFALSSRTWAWMLGAPLQDAGQLLAWANAIGALLAFSPAPGCQERASEAAANSWAYIEGLNAQKNAGGVFDITSAELRKIDVEGGPKGAAALLASLAFDAIDGAGGMTANFIYCLLSNPGQFDAARNTPLLISNGWQEAARFAPSLLGLFRCPAQDIPYEDVVFPAGVNILMLYAAGNRDPDFTSAPNEFNIHRTASFPLSFGGGPRACIGRSLAKIQGQAAVQALLERTKSIELLPHQPDWGPAELMRAIRNIPVKLTGN